MILGLVELLTYLEPVNVTRINHESFFAAGTVYGEVGLSVFLAGAAFRENLGDSRSAKGCIFPYKMRLQDGTAAGAG